MSEQHFVVADAEVLPEIVLKVLEAKKLLARGDCRTSTEVCRKVGISRSAYYKYKDCVFTYEEKLTNKIITLNFVLKDERGVLSAVLSKLYELNANILTLNQSIPIDSAAAVTITVRFNGDIISTAQIGSAFKTVYGVVKCKVVSGE